MLSLKEEEVIETGDGGEESFAMFGGDCRNATQSQNHGIIAMFPPFSFSCSVLAASFLNLSTGLDWKEMEYGVLGRKMNEEFFFL